MKPNRVVAVATAVLGLAGAVSVPLANLDWSSTAGVIAGVGAVAAVPIARSGSVVGIFLILFADSCPLDDEVVLRIERLAENVSFASDKLERENEKDRITRMVSALSATNEAILRAETREKLFELVCDAAALGGKFTATTIALAETGSDFLRTVAATGPSAAFSRTLKVATTEAHPEGRGLTGTAFRTRQPCISNDYLADQRRRAFHGMQHPIHLHGQRFLVLAVNGVPNEDLSWKDTVLVPAGSVVDILLDTTNPGDWMLHCHIAEHLSAGMMMHFTVE